MKILRRVVSVLKPVKAPRTAIYKWFREAWASIAGDASILLSPAAFGFFPLAATAIENSNSATRNLDMKGLIS